MKMVQPKWLHRINHMNLSDKIIIIYLYIELLSYILLTMSIILNIKYNEFMI